MSSTDVVVRPGEAGPVGFVAEDVFGKLEAAFPPERRDQIARFLNIDGDDPAMIPYLAICLQYKLNPMMGEVWLIPKVKREQINGVWQTTETKYSPAIGRDGLLSCARRDPSYGGSVEAVVCENDVFEVEFSTEDMLKPPKIVHKTKGARAQRGAVIGAWCLVKVKNRPYTYFFADISEHGKTRDKNGTRSWEGSWGYTSTMIIKSAVSYAHRLALGITGVLPYDELTPDARAALESGRDVREAADVRIESRVAGELPEGFWDEVRGLVGSAGVDSLMRVTSGWAAARIEMTLTGQDREGLCRIIAQGGEVPPEDEDVPLEGEIVPERINEDADAAEREADNVDQLDENEARGVEADQIRASIRDLRVDLVDASVDEAGEVRALISDMEARLVEIRSEQDVNQGKLL